MTPTPHDGPIGAFAAEFAITLPAIDTALAAVEVNPLEADQAREAYRLCHAVKGAASMVGLAALGWARRCVTAWESTRVRRSSAPWAHASAWSTPPSATR